MPSKFAVTLARVFSLLKVTKRLRRESHNFTIERRRFSQKPLEIQLACVLWYCQVFGLLCFSLFAGPAVEKWGVTMASWLTSAKKAPPAGVSTTFQGDVDPQFPANFFASLNQGNDDEALGFMRAEAMLPDGRTPSPRVEGFIRTGEWDARVKVPLVWVSSDACGGRVGETAGRACILPSSTCTVQSHQKSPHKFIAGWYISHGGKVGHVLTEPFLPREGGPINSRGASRLTDAENKFTLSVG
ncbi:MAG: hypothetical protein WCD18_23700, partial [Thermosynechococcaceae cyanobacterium]